MAIKGSRDSKHWSGVSHCKIRRDVQQSKAWAAITPAARGLYVDMRLWMTTGANGDISATSKTLGALGYRKNTLTKLLIELQAAGLIAKTRGGGVAQGSKVCSLYRFTDFPVIAMPKKGIAGCKATYDYINLELGGASQAQVKACISARIAEMKAEAKAKREKKERPKIWDSKPPVRPKIWDSGSAVYPKNWDSGNDEIMAQPLVSKRVSGGEMVSGQNPLSIPKFGNLSTTIPMGGTDGGDEGEQGTVKQVNRLRQQSVTELLTSGRSSLSGVILNYRQTISRPFDYKLPIRKLQCPMAG